MVYDIKDAIRLVTLTLSLALLSYLLPAQLWETLRTAIPLAFPLWLQVAAVLALGGFVAAVLYAGWRPVGAAIRTALALGFTVGGPIGALFMPVWGVAGWWGLLAWVLALGTVLWHGPYNRYRSSRSTDLVAWQEQAAATAAFLIVGWGASSLLESVWERFPSWDPLTWLGTAWAGMVWLKWWNVLVAIPALAGLFQVCVWLFYAEKYFYRWTLYGFVWLCLVRAPGWLSVQSFLRFGLLLFGVGSLLLFGDPYRRASDETQRDESFLDDDPIDEDSDLLGRRELANALVKCIEKAPSDSSFVIGVYGGWGTGKTSVLRMAERYARADRYPIIWLSAWTYNHPDRLRSAFFTSLVRLVRQHRPFATGGIATLSRMAARLSGAKLPGSWLSAAIHALLAAVPSEQELAEAKEQVEALIRLVAGETKLILFLDDLDRCSPETLVGTLEFLKQIANLRNCVVVAGADIESVMAVLERRWGTKADQFLDKVINVSVSLDEVTDVDLEKMYRTWAGGLFAMSHDEAMKWIHLIAESVGRNPRRIKQFVNNIRARLILQPTLDVGDIAEPTLIRLELIRLTLPMVHSRLQNPNIYHQVGALFQGGPSRDGGADPLWQEKLIELLGLQHGTEQAKRATTLVESLFSNLDERSARNLLRWYQYGGDAKYVWVLFLLHNWRNGERNLRELADMEIDDRRYFIADLIAWKGHSLRQTASLPPATGRDTANYNDTCRDVLRAWMAHEKGSEFPGLVQLVEDELYYAGETGREPFLKALWRWLDVWQVDDAYRLVLKGVIPRGRLVDRLRHRMVERFAQVYEAGTPYSLPRQALEGLVTVELPLLVKPRGPLRSLPADATAAANSVQELCAVWAEWLRTATDPRAVMRWATIMEETVLPLFHQCRDDQGDTLRVVDELHDTVRKALGQPLGI